MGWGRERLDEGGEQEREGLADQRCRPFFIRAYCCSTFFQGMYSNGPLKRALNKENVSSVRLEKEDNLAEPNCFGKKTEFL